MGRGSAQILDDDEEIDLATFMLDACGIDYSDFYWDERILTRGNFEKNFKFLKKMVENRSFRRAPYFVLGYFILITGFRMPEDLRQKMLEVAKWEHEEGIWANHFIPERKICLKDFREKIKTHRPNLKFRPVKLKYFSNLNLSEAIFGLNDFRNALKSGEIDKIRHIKLDGWNLKTMPEEIYELKRLESLSLEFNQMTNIPIEISELQSLKYLNLDYNEITTLPSSLLNLSSLTYLDLDHNLFKHIPESIIRLPSIEVLGLNYNSISSIPESIEDMKSLKTLALDYNYISELPRTIFNLNSLRFLNIRKNKIKEIPEFLRNIKYSIILK
ncbi:MAG: leucine-rich repeat domain-containing protein [Promethearchaeota archaeon]